jgi:hypothetical protein
MDHFDEEQMKPQRWPTRDRPLDWRPRRTRDSAEPVIEIHNHVPAADYPDNIGEKANEAWRMLQQRQSGEAPKHEETAVPADLDYSDLEGETEDTDPDELTDTEIEARVKHYKQALAEGKITKQEFGGFMQALQKLAQGSSRVLRSDDAIHSTADLNARNKEKYNRVTHDKPMVIKSLSDLSAAWKAHAPRPWARRSHAR